MLSPDKHRALAEVEGIIAFAIVTVSDTRTPDNDDSGKLLHALIEKAGHTVVDYRIVRDEPQEVLRALKEFAAGLARIVVFSGGTGISQRDRTYDVVSRMLEKTLPGFGELFRMLSFNEVGAAAMLSRATAGVYQGRVIVSLPGSPNAVQLGMEKLILPEAQHLAWELTR